VVLRVIRDEDIAQEVLQDAFLKIWEKMSPTTHPKEIITWMLNVTRNLAIDRTRSKEMSKSKKTDDLEHSVNRINRQKDRIAGRGRLD